METYALDIQLCSAIRRNLESRILGKEREIELVAYHASGRRPSAA